MRKLMIALALAVPVITVPALAQTYRVPVSAITAMQSGIVAPTPTKWYVRKDGGTRYSVNVPTGQCDGKADVSYASTGGTGVNQHCAYNDWRFMWDDKSGKVGAGAWVIAGGDIVTVRDGPWRLGWDGSTGQTSGNWCYGVGSYFCYPPPIPAGTTAQPTLILGNCAAGPYTCTPGNQGPGNLTQLFGGFSLTFTFNLQSTHDVFIAGIELATHNGQCTFGGNPAYPRSCNNNQPLDDYAQNGFITNNATAHVTLQDVYVHGFNASGFYGPIGGAITMTRVASNFNGFAGYNFNDQWNTPDAPGSSITASHVTMIGNGCYEEYPVKHAFPAQACYNSDTGGFGDAWSGQDTVLDSFLCDHCVMAYNTKDAFIGPHTQIRNLQITNSFSGGNGGAQWKWGSTLNANALFENNLTVTNCTRMSAILPGAVQSFNQATGLGGAYLPSFCRAGDGIAFLTRAGSTNHFFGNTIIAANPTIMDANCGYVDGGGVHQETNCQSSPLVWMGNNILGYIAPVNGGLAPGLWYFDPAAKGSLAVQSSYNNEFGIRNGDTCGANNITCADPLQVAEPPQPWTTEAALDVFDPSLAGNSFYLAANSPLLGKGTAISGRTTDYYGAPLPTPPPIGALALAGAITVPTPPPPVKATPTITWSAPSSVLFGTALSSTQLNAKASTAGTFTYAPAVGTVPALGTDTLFATFTPSDTTNYTSATATAQIVVTQPPPPPPPPTPKAFTFTITHSETITCTPTLSGSTYKWTCK